MNKIYTILTITVLSLTACGSVPQKASTPVIDRQALTLEQQATYSHDLAQCRTIQEKAMPVSLLEVLGSSDVHADERRRNEKASQILRNCLSGRGYAVLY